jgi:NADPH:quinone reductase-like Zn-dependent oxidoreductase
LVLGWRRPKKAILGVELAGEVESVGKDVTRFKKGDPVFAATLTDFGAHAEYALLPEAGPIALKPANTTYAEAAALPIGARTALHYLRKANMKPGQKLLIYGASGSVGTYAVQLANHFGAHVTGVCSAKNLDLVQSLGAHRVIDYTQRDYPQRLEMYDVILVAVDKCPFWVCNKHLNQEGVYANVAAPVKSVSMRWTSLTTRKKIVVGENPAESAEDLVFLKGLVEAGSLKPVIDRSYPLDQVVEAHRYVDQGHKKGNVVIIV